MRLRRVIDAIIKASAKSLFLFLYDDLIEQRPAYIAAARVIFLRDRPISPYRLGALTPPGSEVHAIPEKGRGPIKCDLIYGSIFTPNVANADDGALYMVAFVPSCEEANECISDSQFPRKNSRGFERFTMRAERNVGRDDIASL